MFHSFDYPDETGVNQLAVNFWRPQMVDGVIQFPRPETCPFKNATWEMRPKAFGIGESLRPVDIEALEMETRDELDPETA
jgi:CRISPR-associated protein Cas5d